MPHIAFIAGILAAANLGFMMLNYPLGRIFLGDAGAYFNGLFVGFLMVYLMASSDAVSPWFAVSVLIYPAWETLFTIGRRLLSGDDFSQPDNKHLHSLMFRVGRRTRNVFLHSPTHLLLIGQTTMCLLAVFAYGNTFGQVALSLSFVVMYLVIYVYTHHKVAAS